MVPGGKKTIVITPVLLCGVGILCFLFFREPEPELTPELKIKRDFRKAFNAEESTLRRLEALRRSFRTAGGFPEPVRHRIMVEALAESVNQTFSDFAKLPPEQKKKRAELLREDAEKTLEYFRSLPEGTRKKALALLTGTPSGRAQLDRAVDMTANELTPEDRAMLGPAIKTWKTLLENKK